jgi:hypothetical protein
LSPENQVFAHAGVPDPAAAALRGRAAQPERRVDRNLHVDRVDHRAGVLQPGTAAQVTE